MFRPKVGHKIKHSYESSARERTIFQLRTGYVDVNKDLRKCNIKDTHICHCGSKESVSHFLLHCPEYETEREIMRKGYLELHTWI